MFLTYQHRYLYKNGRFSTLSTISQSCNCKINSINKAVFAFFLFAFSWAFKGNLQKSNQIHIVLGNESCDLDSAVSALVFAYFLKEHVYKSKLDHIVIPILNINVEELPLRTEICYTFEEIGITNDHLVFRSLFLLTLK